MYPQSPHGTNRLPDVPRAFQQELDDRRTTGFDDTKSCPVRGNPSMRTIGERGLAMLENRPFAKRSPASTASGFPNAWCTPAGREPTAGSMPPAMGAKPARDNR